MADTKKQTEKTAAAKVVAAEKLNAARDAWEKEKAGKESLEAQPEPKTAAPQMPWAIPVPILMGRGDPDDQEPMQPPHAHPAAPDIPLPPAAPQAASLVDSLQKLLAMGISAATTALSSGMQIVQGGYGMQQQGHYGQPQGQYQHGHHDSCGCGYQHGCECGCEYDPCCNPSVHGCCR
jgi:hypothetical protein